MPAEREILKIDDDLPIDFNRREVIVRGKRVKLRPTEHRLLHHLVYNAGWVLTNEMLPSTDWGHEDRHDTHLHRLYITYRCQNIVTDP